METTGYPLPTLFQTALGIVGFFFPLMLYVVWATLAFGDLGRRTDLTRRAQYGWAALILVIPWLGAAIYHLAGRSQVPGPVRTAMIGGGVLVYGAVLLLGRAIGGIS